MKSDLPEENEPILCKTFAFHRHYNDRKHPIQVLVVGKLEQMQPISHTSMF